MSRAPSIHDRSRAAQDTTHTNPASDGQRDERTTDTSEISPEDAAKLYGESVKQYASRTQAKHYICGSNFQHLVDFMTSNPLLDTMTTTHSDHKFTASLSIMPDNTRRLEEYANPEEFMSCPPPEPNSCKILFLRGFPSPQWIKVIGSKFRVDPELFRRHLAFLQTRDYFNDPNLESASANMFQLRLPSIFKRDLAITHADVLESRRDQKYIIKKHQQKLGSRIGDSIVRQYHVHDEHYFTIEQFLSCFVSVRKHSWTAIVWLDCGRSLKGADWSPRSFESANSLHTDISCVPVIQYSEKACLNPVPFPNSLDASMGDSRSLENINSIQSASLLPFQYGQHLVSEVMRVDIMYGLSELFSFSAFSENQFINFLQALVEDTLALVDKDEELALGTLRHCNAILHERVTHICETLGYLQRGSELKWPSIVHDSQAASEKRRILIFEYETIVRRTQRLVEQCNGNAGYILEGAALYEARSSKNQARRVEELTKLAFLFVPLAFLCAFFGMNFSEFGQGGIGIWVFFAVASPILIGSLLFVFWQHISLAALRDWLFCYW